MPDSADRLTISDLVHAHYALVYRFAFRLTGEAAQAEDLTQQTFLIAQEHLGELRVPEAAAKWLLTIARHAFFRQRRQQPRAIPLDSVEEPARVERPPSEPCDPEELQNALGEMPEEYRSPLLLYYFEQMSYRDISESLAVPIGTVMSRLSRAKTWLRNKLTTRPAALTRGPTPAKPPMKHQAETIVP